MWHALKLSFWTLVLLLVLSFFGISVQSIVESPAGQANFSYVRDLLVQAWTQVTEFLKV